MFNFAKPQAPAEEDPAGGQQNTVTPEQLTEAMKMMQAGLTQMSKVQEQINTLSQQQQQFPQPEDPWKGEPPQPATMHKPRLSDMQPEEVDAMSRQDYAKRLGEELLEDMTGALKEAIKPMSEQFQTLQSTSAQQAAKSEFQRFREAVTEDGKPKYPAIKELQPVMADLNKRTQGLSLEQLYHIAEQEIQSKDPGLYKQIQDTYNPAPQPESKPQPYTGFAPSLIGKGPSKGNLPVREAAQKAMGEMLETHGPIPDMSQPVAS